MTTYTQYIPDLCPIKLIIFHYEINVETKRSYICYLALFFSDIYAWDVPPRTQGSIVNAFASWMLDTVWCRIKTHLTAYLSIYVIRKKEQAIKWLLIPNAAAVINNRNTKMPTIVVTLILKHSSKSQRIYFSLMLLTSKNASMDKNYKCEIIFTNFSQLFNH